MSFHPHHCPYSDCSSYLNTNPTRFIKKGFLKIRRTNQTVRRFQCSSCRKTFSSRTFKPDYRHKKKDLNAQLLKLLCSGNSLRGASRILGMTFNNTYRKFLWLSTQAEHILKNLQLEAETLLFDEMQTIEHTKCKPLSILIMVNEKYQILSLKVAQMPAQGKLARFSVLKYGARADHRDQVLNEGFLELQTQLKKEPLAMISDARPSYGKFVRKYFPKTRYQVYSRKDKERHRDRLHEAHQKNKFDPMFEINQRCALLRDRVKRLARRSWCTTKKPENLQRHLNLFLVSQYL